MSDHQKLDIARLKKVLIEATGPGKAFTRRSLAMAASEGRNPDLVRNILSGTSRNPTMGTIGRLADVLGLDVGSFFYDAPSRVRQPGDFEWLTVSGKVEAGSWMAHSEWSDDERFTVPVSPSPFPDAPRFGLVVEGRSMDLTFRPGTVLDCVKVGGPGVRPMIGDYVIVERTMNDLRETTCKRLAREDGQFQLICESSRPEFQAPIPIGAPDREYHGDDDIRIVGLVIGSYAQFFGRR